MAGSLTLIGLSRAEKGLSLRDAARAAGIGEFTFRQIERAERRPHLPTLKKICDALQLDIQAVIADLDDRLDEDNQIGGTPRRRRPEPAEAVS